MYGSVVAPKRCVVHSTGRLRFSPLPPFRVSTLSGNSTLIASKMSTSTFVKKNSLLTIAFDANTSIKYTDDQTPSVDSKYTDDVTQNNTVSASNVEEIDVHKASDEELSSPPKNYAKIHDFCLGIPYGGFLLAMGIIGFLIWRNPESLFLGIAPGAAIFVLGITSLKVWRGGKSSVPFILAQAAIASVLVWKYVQAFNLTKKLLPWGFYGFISAAMICFYLYVMASGGNPPPKKKAMVAPSS